MTEYTKEQLLRMSKKQLVKIAGYPNIRQLCKDNPDFRRKSIVGRKKDGTPKVKISSKAPSRKQLIRELV